MNTPLIAWVCIAAAIALLILTHIIKTTCHHSVRRHRHHFIEIGSEREEFFVPGDPIVRNDHERDNNL